MEKRQELKKSEKAEAKKDSESGEGTTTIGFGQPAEPECGTTTIGFGQPAEPECGTTTIGFGQPAANGASKENCAFPQIPVKSANIMQVRLCVHAEANLRERCAQVRKKQKRSA